LIFGKTSAADGILVLMNANKLTLIKQVLLYGVLLALLLFLLKWLELNFIIIHYSFEIYAGAIALVFTGLGIWLALKLTRPKLQTVVIETIVPKDVFSRDERMLRELRISIRELEILTLMAQGLSNQQMADRLFVSLNTIKTHAANLFLKMEVERRTQAVEKGRRLSLIP